MVVRFFAPGHPATKGSYRYLGRGRVANDNPREKAWAAVVALAAESAMKSAGADPIEGPVFIRLAFQLERPRSHYKASGGLRAGRPLAPTSKPDWDKLSRSIGDAMTGICYRDDAQIVHALVSKRYAMGEGVRGMVGALVEVHPWPSVSAIEDEESPFTDEER